MLPTCQFSFNIESNVLNDKYDHVDFFQTKWKISFLLLYKTANHLS